MLNELKKDLETLAEKEKAAFFPRFFKTGKGQYGEGDKFIGVTVPNQRKIAKKYFKIPLPELQKLLTSPIHEHRLTALLILVDKYQKTDQKQEIFDFYLQNLSSVNNWDLVDSSAPKIIGAHLLNKPRALLYQWAKSPDLWQKRIAILSTYTFIHQKDYTDTLKIAEILLQDKHDLIHKAVGWMLREIGKLDQPFLEKFLHKWHKNMPRTMLRYAIEKLDTDKRRFFMQ